ncbi:MAG: hypothetical protein WA954_00655 [Parerythrobacter sp.]
MRVLAGVCALALAGCVTPYPDLSQSRSPCRSEPGGWCGFVRQAAVESYGYAMLPANAYGPEDDDFYAVLPPEFARVRVSENDESGLAYTVYDRYKNAGRTGALLARVIAFRGTEFGSRVDIVRGSLRDNQIEAAAKVYAAERAALDAEGNTDVQIEATGHSLGGALATQMSIDHADVRAVVFNTSPLFAGDPMVHDTQRLALAERGEFLRLLRRYSTPPAANTVVVNCNPSAGAAAKHSIRRLGDCLAWIAAYDHAAAVALLAANSIGKPEAECGPVDKAHTGPIAPADYATLEPCPHAARVEQP